MTTIRTPRLLLRKPVEADLDALHPIMADAETIRFWSTPPHADREDTRRFLADMIAAPVGTSDEFVVEWQGQVIGKLGVWRVPEVGFFLSRTHWGRGLATEALVAFVRHAFAAGADHLTADVDPANAASLAVLTKAGFRETARASRTLQIGDDWFDGVYLRLDRPAVAVTRPAPHPPRPADGRF